ncbi:outer membrane lipoprotein-sorting protein [Parvularcula sp. IMCC14364]|uniref:outer membrane lipoprotein-sorting protein n=1 Tax=Parvularcula sp. IMCC14364 TaxID=3067902 RepID=UPI0027403E81|nr:outer membrane lipoprotein-sorting protein [Parvularcula sp. IMCC14364]
MAFNLSFRSTPATLATALMLGTAGLVAGAVVTPLLAQDATVEAAPADFINDPEARGTTAEAQKGYDIAARSDRTDHGYGNSRVNFTMVLRNSAGQEATREVNITTLEKPDETVGDKSLVIFETPADVRGTALLSHAKILEPDDQWLYLPALKREKRIASANKSGPFVGSEFAFEDFTTQELNKFTYKFISEGELDGMAVDIIERYPRYENSGYTRQVSYTDQEIFQVRKVEFYDRRDALLKTLTLEDYREYDNGVYRAHKFTMVNHQTNKETDLVYEEYEFGLGLDENDFVKGVLRRIR